MIRIHVRELYCNTSEEKRCRLAICPLSRLPFIGPLLLCALVGASDHIVHGRRVRVAPGVGELRGKVDENQLDSQSVRPSCVCR